MQRLKSFYIKHVIPLIKENFSYKNVFEVPKIKKIVVSRSFDDSCQNTKTINNFLNEVNIITCQYPKITRSKKSIANFKLKQGTIVGMYVSLRGDKMYSFLDRLINISLPRIRDFQGLSPESFDRFGNYSLGFKEQLLFPEIDFEKVSKVSGLNVNIVIHSRSKQESYFLLKELGMPFKNS
jgi:large subunit ribosomal protein L5